MSKPTREQVEAWIKADDFERAKIEVGIGIAAHELSDLAWDMDLSRIPYNPLRSDNLEDWQWVNKSQYEAIQVKRRRKNANRQRLERATVGLRLKPNRYCKTSRSIKTDDKCS